jgi:RHS repeat-associated protein
MVGNFALHIIYGNSGFSATKTDPNVNNGSTSISMNSFEDVQLLSLSEWPTELYVSDFDGDKLKDICILNRYGANMFRNTGSTLSTNGDNGTVPIVSFTKVNTLEAPDGIFSKIFNANNNLIQNNTNDFDVVRQGDFDGDMLPDFILHKKGSTEWDIAYSDGKFGFVVQPISNLTNTANNLPTITGCDVCPNGVLSDHTNDNNGLFVMDFDGNGMSDFVLVADSNYYNDPNSPLTGTNYVTWFRAVPSTNSNQRVTFQRQQFTQPMQYNSLPYFSLKNTMCGDFNGDGRMDLMSFGVYLSQKVDDGTPRDKDLHLNCTPLPYADGKVSSITDPLGNMLSFGYKPMTDQSIYTYNTSNNDNTKLFESPIPLSLLTRSSVTNGGVKRNVLLYNYQGGTSHSQGKGFLGFRSMTTTDSIAGFVAKKTNTVNSQYKVLYPLSSVKNAVSGDSISYFSQTSLLKANSSYPISFQIISTQQINKDELTGAKVLTTITSDAYANPSQIIKTYDGGLVENTIYTNYVSNGSKCPHLPQQVNITRTYNGDTYTRLSNYVYDTKGNVTSEIINPGNVNNLQIAKSYTYDLFGNKTQEITTGKTTTSNVKSKIKTASYDDSGRFLTSTIDEFNDTTKFVYSSGLLYNKIDHTGTTTYAYDNFCRNTQITYPDLTSQTTTLSWGNTQDNYTYQKAITLSGKPTQKYWYNSYDEEVLRSVTGMDNNDYSVSTSRLYDGKIATVSTPYIRPSSYYTKEAYLYDKFNRKISYKTIVTDTTLVQTTYAYSGLKVTATSPEATIQTTYDGAGQKLSTSTNGRIVNFTYWASGLLKSSMASCSSNVSLTYDINGNRSTLTSPEEGVTNYTYNAFGELLQTTEAVHTSGEVVTASYTYSIPGLLMQKTINNSISNSNSTTKYTYDAKNRLTSEEIIGQHKKGYTYDSFDRVTQTTETLDGSKIFTSQNVYDKYGNVSKYIYPSGFFVQNNYSSYGYLTSVQDPNNNILWQFLSCNNNGQITSEKKGNLTQTNAYYLSGLPTSESCTNVFGLQYTFDNKRNMLSKQNLIAGQTEKYLYDNMNRLTEWDMYNSNNQLLNQNTITISTAVLNAGDVTYKSDNDYEPSYGQSGYPAHAVTSVTANLSAVPNPTETINYTDFKKVQTIKDIGLTAGTTINNELDISYGTDEERYKSVFLQMGTAQLTRYYLDNYEEERNSNNIRKIHYISGGNGLVAIYAKDSIPQKDTIYYAFTDYQRNLVALTDVNGNVYQRLAYDPWGNRRNPDDWTQKAASTTHYLFNRGYTLHEHLDAFALINMSGRVYDPVLGTFLSPDPYIQAADNWLNYNRYSYCLGNPLRYTDPTGKQYGSINGVPEGYQSNESNSYNVDAMHTEDQKRAAQAAGDQMLQYFYQMVNALTVQAEKNATDRDHNYVNPIPPEKENPSQKGTIPFLQKVLDKISIKIDIEGNSKLTIGVQIGGNIGGLVGTDGFFCNLFSITLIGDEGGKIIYPTSQEGGLTQVNQTLSGGYNFGAMGSHTFDANFGEEGGYRNDLYFYQTYFGEKQGIIGIGYDGESLNIGINIQAGFIIGFEGSYNFKITWK